MVAFDWIEGVDVLGAASGTKQWHVGFDFVAAAPRATDVIGRGRNLSRRAAATGAVQWEVMRRHGEVLVVGDQVVVVTPGQVHSVGLIVATRWRHSLEGVQSTPVTWSGDVVVLSQ